MGSSIAPIFLCVCLQFLIGELRAQQMELFAEDFRINDTPLKQSEEASPLQCTHRCLREANCNSLAYKLKGNAHNVVCALYSLVIINFLTESTSLVADKGWRLYAKKPQEEPKCDPAVTCKNMWSCCHVPVTSSSANDLIGKTWRFEPFNKANSFLMKDGSLALVKSFSTGTAYGKNSQWLIVAGLCGQGISFKSKYAEKTYVRHRKYIGRVNQNDGSATFRDDACFNVRNGLADSRFVSFESVNVPGYFLQHHVSEVLMKKTEASQEKKDATWKPRYLQ